MAARQNSTSAPHGSPYAQRTADFKIAAIGRWLRGNGASPADPATLGLGISLDEIQRVSNPRVMPYERCVYPLLEHESSLRRANCQAIIAAAGSPVPGRSACWFCPMRRPAAFAAMARDRPNLFTRACELEELLNTRQAAWGRDPVWLTRFNQPLARAVAAAQDELPGIDGDADGSRCDNGACFT
jgi:hypothetical protein